MGRGGGRGGETKILNRAGTLGQGVGALKRGRGWNPLTNDVLLQTDGKIINSLLYDMFRRKSCGFIKVFMLEESVTKGNIIKAQKQCELFNTIARYATRTTGTYGRFYCLTIFQFAH